MGLLRSCEVELAVLYNFTALFDVASLRKQRNTPFSLNAPQVPHMAHEPTKD